MKGPDWKSWCFLSVLRKVSYKMSKWFPEKPNATIRNAKVDLNLIGHTIKIDVKEDTGVYTS